jgi:putative addiction module component (TIGR02574 family)
VKLEALTAAITPVIFLNMSTKEITAAAMALPLPKRVELAQALWDSVDAGLTDDGEALAVREASRRDKEISSGAVKGRSHDEVMQAARRAIR